MATRFSVLFGCSLLLVSAAAIQAGRLQPGKPEPAQPETVRNGEPAKPAEGAKPARPKFDEAKALADLRKAIAGKEEEPADKVFMDIQLLKAVPAGRLLLIMEKGYSRSLGVSCNHCHVPGEWQSDQKKEKTAARGMIQMTGTINSDLLPKVKGLDTDHQPIVNCTTCHRGQVKPALNMP